MKPSLGLLSIAVLSGISRASPAPELFNRAPSCAANQCNAFLNSNFQKAKYLCSSLVKSLSISTATATKLVTKTTGTSTTTATASITRGITTTTTTYTFSYTSTLSVIKRQEGSLAAKSFSSAAVSTCGGKVSSVSQACSCLSTSTTATRTIQTVKHVTATSKVTVNSVTRTKTIYSETVVATVRPTSLIYDGDFEDQNWGRWGSLYDLIIISPGQGGSKYAGAVNKTFTDDGIGSVSYNTGIPVNPGEQYYFSFDLKMLNNQCSIHSILGIEAQYIFGTPDFATPVGQWTQQNITFVSTDNVTSVDFTLFCSGSFIGPTIAFDNFLMLPVSSTIYSPSSPATGANLVKNGNFATGSLSPWTQASRGSADYQFQSPGYNGDSYELVVTMPDNIYYNSLVLNQALPTTFKDKVYSISMAFQSYNDYDSGNFGFEMGLIDPVSQSTDTISFDETTLPAAGEWGIVSGVFAAPASNASVTIMVSSFNQNVFYFDDIKVLPLD